MASILNPHQNLILAALTAGEAERVLPALQLIALKLGDVLYV